MVYASSTLSYANAPGVHRSPSSRTSGSESGSGSLTLTMKLTSLLFSSPLIPSSLSYPCFPLFVYLSLSPSLSPSLSLSSLPLFFPSSVSSEPHACLVLHAEQRSHLVMCQPSAHG